MRRARMILVAVAAFALSGVAAWYGLDQGLTDEADLPIGTVMVQLGAYDSPAEARAAWDGIQSQAAALVEGHPMILIEVRSPQRRYYRLRLTGFDTIATARTLCEGLVAQELSCIPVTLR